MLVFKKKLLLKEYEYFLLKECRYPSEQTVLQSTHYYDTQDYRLNKAGITCCIQEQNGRCTAIVRDHRVQWEDCTIENSVSVRSKWDDSFFQNMELRFQGNMETQRTVFVLWPGGKIYLDRNGYLGVQDYEFTLTYEHAARTRAASEMESVLDCLSFHRGGEAASSFKKRLSQSKSKSVRFFEKKAILDSLLKEE
jgi:uncharacterized protein YjbK